MAMCWPPKRLSEVILAVESSGSLIPSFIWMCVSAWKLLGSRAIFDTVPTFTPATFTSAPGVSEPAWPNLAINS